ncbi:pyridoxal 5'-phosphate synthase glutaminase subunit PdxT [Pyrobaculum neutrophilum]|uniref:Pyridoxal 5'-phosphate synthase subunit PdxT n=1 Tax=Pyrobaculum neutrophilum (strain DSM 2338 / JCM 9278 / NBRC 100436 / V24Sta) TaxID=444157 RepID=PDXT_PYRNV|nr:pyridoxal 5'-phosphate synthase glutaminase subunit PdxT [Pyrobaculum neutrophilum]B1YB90.1 RecName: Full=Pyridoxal 5'-phosphate synthase subunit PdxT; AltName: Full=Pdx2; AltName: Full=Pyridoxal 5'-phosphate synthase glutaminase subunit [Pyrobaculum neutrophilum V24Sta]ACB39221.1 SNO glutamine amidotransferase [Pyrobaculum neutrophilum V24Sta]
MKAGVLALQGDVEEHIQAFRKAAQELGRSVEVVQVKRPQDLREIAVLAIPGGESTTIGALARRTGLLDALRDAIKGGLPTLGTCAGAIFLAKEVRDSVVGETKQPILGLMDIAVVRNAFGRQRESFEVDLREEGIGALKAVFIRAPAFTKAWGSARLAAPLKHPELGQIYAAAFQGHMVATAFHPELSTTAVHRYMLNLAKT